MKSSQLWMASLVVLVLYVIWNWILGAASIGGFVCPAWGSWGWWLASIAFAVFFTIIYIKGLDGGGISDGLRYGLFLGLLWYLPGFFMGLAGGSFGPALWHALAGIVGFIIYGIGASFLIKPASA